MSDGVLAALTERMANEGKRSFHELCDLNLNDATLQSYDLGDRDGDRRRLDWKIGSSTG